MGKTQNQIAFIALLIISLMGAFPPWAYVDQDKVSHPMGYAPIWAPPVQRQHDSAEILGFKLEMDVRTQTANSIDWLRLLTQIAIVSGIAGGAAIFTRRSRA